MNSDRWAVAEALFDRAISLPPSDRAELIDAATEGDPELRTLVERLIRSHDADPGFLEITPPWLAETYAGTSPDDGPSRGPRTDDADPADHPERIGEYRILEVIGRGGMGQVYLAEREAPGFRQRVALKLLRRGLDTDDLVRRFRNERQILASLDHPNIARLLDVGATGDGRPYFVMEHVDGRPITEHCDARRLDVRARLHLFRTVCSAVQHAHQSLVVHRDLKPGNILVTDAGVPKLLDFGIAKIMDPRVMGADEDPVTRAGERLLTPEYASPEQLRGDVVTTACDIHALGILLYELLAGRHPFAHDRPSTAELTRRVLQGDPPAPSAALGGDSPDALRRALRGDLDTITLRALRKEPDERYPSAQGLSDDIRRHLHGEPVEARPATVGYRVRKFVGRNRLAVAAAAAAFLLLGGFSAVTARQSLRIREESTRVAHERDKAREVRTFLLETFGSTGPDQPTGGTVTVRDLLDRRAATLDETFGSQPELRAEMTGVLAEAYEKLGIYDRAEELARDALDRQRAIHGDVHVDVATTLNTLGWVQHQLRQLDSARVTLTEAVRVGRLVFPASGDGRLARALNDLGVVNEALGHYDAAADLYRESLDMRDGLGDDTQVGYAVTTSNLAVVHYRRGDLDAAAEMAARAVASFTRVLGTDHDRTTIARANLAAIRSVAGDREGAVAVYREILDRHRRVLGERHAQVAFVERSLANQLLALGRYDEAGPLLTDALEIERAAPEPRPDRVAMTLRLLGDLALETERYDEARRHQADALPLLRAIVGDAHAEVAIQRHRLARAQRALGQRDSAEANLRTAVQSLRAAAGPGHRNTLDAALSLVELLVEGGRDAEAVALMDDIRPAVDSVAAQFPPLAARLDSAARSVRR